MNSFFILVFSLLLSNISAQQIDPPKQPLSGPGGGEYICDSIHFQDFAQQPDGFWLFEPICPTIDSAHVVVFVHGYGAMNPMIYGNWIKHLVRKGNIVIFPRYQKNLFSPSPKRFTKNVATGIQNALIELDTGNHVKPIVSSLALIGHSYGGVVCSNLAVNYKKYDLPQPEAVMLCSPGSGPFKGGVLDSYEAMPENVHLLIMVSDDDRIVRDKLGVKIFETARQVSQRNLIRQFPDDYSKPKIRAGHNESYSLYTAFDSGNRNMTAKRAKRKSALDAVDYFGYWKLFDALADCTRNSTHCQVAFGDTPEQRFMGEWSDGTTVRNLEIEVPEQLESQANN